MKIESYRIHIFHKTGIISEPSSHFQIGIYYINLEIIAAARDKREFSIFFNIFRKIQSIQKKEQHSILQENISVRHHAIYWPSFHIFTVTILQSLWEKQNIFIAVCFLRQHFTLRFAMGVLGTTISDGEHKIRLREVNKQTQQTIKLVCRNFSISVSLLL